MKRFMKVFAVIFAASMSVMLAACSGPTLNRNPYDVAVEMGYEGSPGNWYTDTISSDTKEHRLYEEAKKEGYEGSFVDFLKEIGLTASGGIDSALMSTVSIVTRYRSTVTAPGIFGDSSKIYSSAGSGVIYSLDHTKGDAYIITNYHVIYSSYSAGNEKIAHVSDDITVYLYGCEIASRGITAEFVGGAKAYDLAVLKISDSKLLRESSAFAASIGNSDAISVGQDVYAVGNPNADGISAVKGVVSVEAEYIDIELADNSGTTNLLEIRTDAPINHGNSGGGLYDAGGNLIGIVNARSEAIGVENFGYAIPSNLVAAVVQNIIDNSAANSSHGAMRAMLGIAVRVSDRQGVYDEDTDRAYILETVTVDSVEIGQIAYGKLLAGDVLYSVQIGDRDPMIITRMHVLTNVMFSVRKGNTLKIVVSRGEGLVTVELTFSENGDFQLFD